MIAIIDYGIGNLRSVQRALQAVDADAQIITTPAELSQAEKIVLPGVAAFGDAMEHLRQRGLLEPIVSAVKSGTPYLGFCLGLQLLFDVSYEGGEHRGMGLLSGKVVKFDFTPQQTGQRLAVPHMGWNRIHWTRPCPMQQGMGTDPYVYFAHSYHVVPMDESIIVTTTDYGYPFVSSVWKDNIFATQFHPEKSQIVGRRFLENFVSV